MEAQIDLPKRQRDLSDKLGRSGEASIGPKGARGTDRPENAQPVAPREGKQRSYLPPPVSSPARGEARCRKLSIGHDLGSDAAIREDLKQEGMVLASIDDVRLAYAAIESAQTGFNLRQHALGNHPMFDQLGDVGTF
jgi:hypothetical protein